MHFDVKKGRTLSLDYLQQQKYTNQDLITILKKVKSNETDASVKQLNGPMINGQVSFTK